MTQEGKLEEPYHRAITCCWIISYTIVFKKRLWIRGDSSSVRVQRTPDDDQNQRSDRNLLLDTNYLMNIHVVCIECR